MEIGIKGLLDKFNALKTKHQTCKISNPSHSSNREGSANELLK